MKKTITVKNSFFEIFAIESGRLQRLNLPVKLAFFFNRNFEKIRQESVPYFETKRKIGEKYAERDENGNIKTDAQGNYQIKDMSKFVQELRELQEQEVELELDVVKVKPEELDGIKITPVEMSCLPFLEIEE